MQVYETLRAEILALTLRPGDVLDEVSLARRFNLSRSPIREALSKLQSERLVTMQTNRSPIVTPINLIDFPKFIEALDLSQRFNTRLAARNRTDADLFRIRQISKEFDESVKRFDPLELSEGNARLHVAISEAGGNPYTTRQYTELLNEGRRFLHIHFEALAREESRPPWRDQHEEMIQAIADRDLDLADRLAHEHTMNFQERFLRALHKKADFDFRIEPAKKTGSTTK
ncbi:GntR family transcriptional regulator [Pseudosulfitobacter pseudonitzschiae]|uniref:GntR family transcriptional regulator n=1 Tax=Pseudosulfitobacter pseudonitzschiae TaxID=1402135 RepID=UPI002022D514|nr:GntR family transcriptional regulator [Pseudosulfitobacter pseudonitzschiae]